MKTRVMKYSVLFLMMATLLFLTGLGIAQNKQQGLGVVFVKYILDDFEDAGTWVAEMPRDQGVIFSMKRSGAPNEVKAIVEAMKKNNQEYIKNIQLKAPNTRMSNENPLAGFPYNENKFVLGVRVEFMKRGYNWFTVRPSLPIKIPGICKSISVWVVGRGFNHELWLMIRDFKGRRRYLQSATKLNHTGWRNVIFPIKDDKITQKIHNVNDPKKIGIMFDGFLIQCDPMDAQGKYYIYFDLLVAEVDIYFDFAKGGDDDIRDFW